MNEDKRRRAEEELGLGEIPEDPAPEIDARTSDSMRAGHSTSRSSSHSIFRLPAWITIPLLLSSPFAVFWGIGVAREYLRYGQLIFSNDEEFYYAIPFFLQLSLAVVYYLGASIVYVWGRVSNFDW